MAVRPAIVGQSIRSQLIWASLFPAVLFGMLAVMLAATAMREPSHQFVVQRNEALARAAAGSIDADCAASVSVLQAAAAAIAGRSTVLANAGQALGDVAPLLQQFEGGVVLLGGAGAAIDATPERHARQRAGQDYVAYLAAAQQAGRPVVLAGPGTDSAGESTAVVVAPVLWSDGSIGALAGELVLQQRRWAGILAGSLPGPRSRLYVADRQGHAVYHISTGSADSTIFVDNRLLQALAADRPQSLVRPEPPNGDQIIISVVPLQYAGWSLVLEEPAGEPNAIATSFQWVLAALLALGTGLSALMLSLGVTRAIRPLGLLANEAQKLGPGEVFRPLALEGPGELRTLTDAFNQLMIRLAEQRAMLHEYALQALRSQEDERMRLSRELHDETLQEMVALVQRIELWRSEPDGGPGAQKLWLDELHQVASRSVTGLRQISTSLRPSILEHLGLAVAVDALCDELGQSLPAAHMHCEIVGDERRLAPELELTAYRVAQEALSNVRKHAQDARHVNATVYFEQWGIMLTVEDDGAGFDVPDAYALLQAGHLGIAGMFERARLFGGKLSVTSTGHEGTAVTLRLPAPEQEDAQ